MQYTSKPTMRSTLIAVFLTAFVAFSLGNEGNYSITYLPPPDYLNIHYGPSMMSQGKTPRKDPQVGLEAFEGSFQVKDALERPLRPL